jgi:hypothetical protein
MNIFVLDVDPVKAAQAQCDKHVVKMTLETGQMLSTIQRANGNDLAELYKPTHIHHPCTLWAGNTADNYGWLVRHFYALAEEYAFRYGKEHLTFKKLRKIVLDTPEPIKRKKGLTPFALAMPDKYKSSDQVSSYRDYYRNEKKNFLHYTKRPAPFWLAQGSGELCAHL